jgi:hypothetical protein
VSDYLLTIPSIILIFFLPGFSFARVFRVRFANLAETLFYSVSLSFALVVAIGFVLGNTIGISTATVLATYALVGTLGAISVIRELQILLFRRQDLRQNFSNYLTRTHLILLSGILVAVAITAFNWYPGIGTHGIDMGEHVFWAKTIIATGRLPNYLSVEPLDQAVKFTYGAHLILAQFFLLAGIPIEEYTWIPTLIGSLGVLVGVVLFALRVTGSGWAAVVAGILYGSAYQPGAYIERGNLPDVVGYLLLVSTLNSILRVRKTPSLSFALGLTTVSVIACHQLATVILPTTILFAIVFSYIRSRSELAETLRSIFAGRARLCFWAVMLMLAVVYAGTETFVSASAASQLVTGNWRIYAPAPYLDPFAAGVTLGLLGIAGLLVILPRRTLGFMLLLGWISALIFLANALLIGIPIPDPLRFLWRLSEPFSILGGIFACFVVTLLARDTPLALPLVRLQRRWIRSAGALLMIAIIGVQMAGLVVPSLEGISDVWSSPPRYRHIEAFYEDDKQIGRWLALNASPTAVIANDADVDATATWVQVYSMKLHFIYRVDFAAIVAPANYIQIYQSTKILYENPSDARVPLIIQSYNLTYVVAHTAELPLFSSSPYFCRTPTFQSGGSALFATKAC